METKLKYHTELDFLNDKELTLLRKACDAIQHFVSKSDRCGKDDHKTRDAHVTPYSSLKGIFVPFDNFEEAGIFAGGELDCIIRISNAHMKLVSQKRTVPAYGFSVKLSDDNKTVLNLPLVNFPLFPLINTSRFLKIFTAVNRLISGKIFTKCWSAAKIIKNLLMEVSGFLSPSFIAEAYRLICKWKNFILSFEYHSIGAYRLGDHVVKYKLVPISVNTKMPQDRIDLSIEDYLRNHNYELLLMVQYCYNIKDQPINVLNKMWKRSDFISIGKIQISKLIDKDDPIIEGMSFNPFESIEALRPVGKLQKLRDEAYKASYKNRLPQSW